MSETSSPTPSIEFEEEKGGSGVDEDDAEEEQEDIGSFRQWMGFVNRCLKGRLTEEDTGGNEEKEELLDDKNESEAERNMRIARSVLDEETALDMARTFIKLTKVPTNFIKIQRIQLSVSDGTKIYQGTEEIARFLKLLIENVSKRKIANVSGC